ncbi:response regulator [Acidisphaera sp. L21]|uniref:response regulator n=1 Tax=Acidisphaera sp. L21 TaxID=1641851 RepID=UPI00131D8955|nr:response regulator [Acidisphaera sp. L21]
MGTLQSVSAKPVVVVLVEDEFLIRALMADVLSDAGFDVREAADAHEALVILQAHQGEVSLLFTDIHMPGTMDGLALVHHVHENWPWIRLLIASGKARLEPSDLPPGAHFVPKPYDLKDTVDRVRRMAIHHTAPPTMQ